MHWLAQILPVLAEPWFAIPWYLIGALGAAWMMYDSYALNTPLNPPLKGAWPIIIFFFSIIGIALYWIASRPSGIGEREGEERLRHFTEYSRPRWRKVIGSAIHCVGGDGLGIMTAMVLARIWGFCFWHEFWFEYIVGYAFGWFIFQTWAMRLHGQGWLMALWMGGRAEFFSMITVMLGMGLVMRYVTPAAVGAQPLPDTYAFWTFGALGLIVGFVFTLPMNYWLVAIGWKHGQGREHLLMQKRQHETQAGHRRRPARGTA